MGTGKPSSFHERAEPVAAKPWSSDGETSCVAQEESQRACGGVRADDLNGTPLRQGVLDPSLLDDHTIAAGHQARRRRQSR